MKRMKGHETGVMKENRGRYRNRYRITDDTEAGPACGPACAEFFQTGGLTAVPEGGKVVFIPYHQGSH